MVVCSYEISVLGRSGELKFATFEAAAPFPGADLEIFFIGSE
jgi:hypothetical protein